MKIDFSKILETFNGLNDQLRYSIFGTTVLLVVLLDVFLVVLPQCGGINSVNDQVQKLSADTTQVITDKQRVNQLRKNLKQAHLNLAEIVGKVRSLQEVPAILETISSIANDYDVKIDRLTPQKQGQESLKVTEDGHYYALPIVIQARCGYHMFGRFLNKLEDENLWFVIKEMNIQSDEKTPNLHSFSLTIKIILIDKTRG